MSTLSLRLPDSLHRALRDLAKQEGISINQLAANAVAEKIAALKTEEYLKQRAARGSRDRFEEALSHVPDVQPASEDQIEP